MARHLREPSGRVPVEAMVACNRGGQRQSQAASSIRRSSRLCPLPRLRARPKREVQARSTRPARTVPPSPVPSVPARAEAMVAWSRGGAAGATTIPVNAPAQPATPAPAANPRAAPPPAGNGQVWVNTDSHIYHCPGDRWYGKTKQGAYMSEAQAQAQGAKPDHGRTCKS